MEFAKRIDRQPSLQLSYRKYVKTTVNLLGFLPVSARAFHALFSHPFSALIAAWTRCSTSARGKPEGISSPTL